jgi:hypothetical protein
MSESSNMPNGSQNEPGRRQIDRRTFMRDISLLSFLALVAPTVFKACAAPMTIPHALQSISAILPSRILIGDLAKRS